jgi:outer membrane protein
MIWRLFRLAIPLLLIGAPGIVCAQTSPGSAAANTSSSWRLGAAFGYGERTNPLVQSDDLPIIVDVDIAWFGERWFFDNGDGGYTFADNDRFTASLIGRVNSDRVFFSRTNTKFIVFDSAGVPIQVPAGFQPPERDYAIEIGVELLTDGSWGALQLSAFQDASGTHDGFELGADYSFSWRRGRLHVEPSFGVSYKSQDLNDYYWGLTAAEGQGVLSAYQADAGVNWNTRLTVAWQLNRNWAATLSVDYERLNDEAFESPIVEERSVRGVFAGVARRF